MNKRELAPLPIRVDKAALRERAMTSLVRACVAQASRVFERDSKGRMPDAADVLARRGWRDELAAMLVRGATAPATTTTAGWAQELTRVSLALLDALIPMSAAAQVLSEGWNLSFDNASSVLVPGISGGSAGWVQEGQPIAVVRFLTDGPTLTPHKLASTSALTLEMLTGSSAEQIVRQALIDSTSAALDAALFSSAAGSAVQPAGLLAGAVSVSASASADALGAMATDCGALASAVAAFGGNGGLMFIANPAQAMRYLMLSEAPVPMAMSAAVPAGTVICIATNALASIVEQPSIDAATSTVLHMDDSSPQPVGSASPSRSMYQTASAALRIVLPVTWCIRNPLAVSYTASVKW
jgi:hypothetical protein